MKRKIFSILFTLVLVVSFSLIPAVPVAEMVEAAPSPSQYQTALEKSADYLVSIQDDTGFWAKKPGGSWDADAENPTGNAITALLEAYSIRGKEAYKTAAIAAGDYLISVFIAGDGSFDVHQAEIIGGNAYMNHLSPLLTAWIKLYQETADSKYLDAATAFGDYLLTDGARCTDDTDPLYGLFGYLIRPGSPGLTCFSSPASLYHGHYLNYGYEQIYGLALLSQITGVNDYLVAAELGAGHELSYQKGDGSFPDEMGGTDTLNIHYGSVKVLAYLKLYEITTETYSNAVVDYIDWLLTQQNPDSSFGGSDYVRSTTWAAKALLGAYKLTGNGDYLAAANKAVSWLLAPGHGYDSSTGAVARYDESTDVYVAYSQTPFALTMAQAETDIPTEVWVDATGSDSNPGTQGSPFATIQRGIDAVAEEGTVNVADGTYTEKLTVNKSLTLQAGSTPIIDCSDKAALGLAKEDGCVEVTADNVTIQGFKFIGYDPTGESWSDQKSSSNYATIKVTSGADGLKVKNNEFIAPPGGKAAVALLVDEDSDNVEFTGNTVTNFLQGVAGHKSVDNLLVEDNTFAIPVVENPALTPPEAYGYGVQLWHGNNLQVVDNTFTGSIDQGTEAIYTNPDALYNHYAVSTFTTYFASAFAWPDIVGDIHIKGNEMVNLYLGVGSFAGGGEVENNNIHNNILGIQLGQVSGTWATAPTAGLAITGNEITNNTRGIWVQSIVPDGIFAHYNNIVGNTEHGVINEDPEGDVFDATNNWWGSPSGPEHAGNTFNVDLQGNKVSDYVDYVPWCDTDMTGASFAPVTNEDTGDEFSSIQAAIDDADTDANDTINVAAGTYTEDVTLNKNVSIYGGSPKPTLKGTGAPVGSKKKGALSFAGPLEGITIKDIIIEYDGPLMDVPLMDAGYLDPVFNGVEFIGMEFIQRGTWRSPNVGGKHPINFGWGYGSSVEGAGVLFKDCVMTNASGQDGTFMTWQATGGGPTTFDNVTIDGNGNKTEINIYGGTNVTVTNNCHTMDNAYFYLSGLTNLTVENNIFSGYGTFVNGVNGANIRNNVFENTRGLEFTAAWGPTQNYDVLVEGNTFQNIDGDAIKIHRYTGSTPDSDFLDVHYNNFIDIGGFAVNNTFDTFTVDATNNWWGTNDGPSASPGSGDKVSANVYYDPWLVIGISADPFSIEANGTSTSTITADMTWNSGGEDTSALGHIPDGTQITFRTSKGSIGNQEVNETTTDGIAIATLTSSATVETATVTASAPPHTPAATATTAVFFTKSGVTVEDSESEKTETGDDTVDATDEADTKVDKSGTGTPTITVAEYSSNPGTGFSGDIGKYVDVHIDSDEGVDEIVIKVYYTSAEIGGRVESSLRLRWWNGTSWVACSDSGVNTTDIPPTYSGYMWAKVRIDTIPTLAQLSGTVFGGHGGTAPPPPPPTVTLESIAASPSSLTLGVDETQQLTVTATYSDASTADVTAEASYESSDTSVTTVSDAGLITGVAEGSAAITVSYTEDEIEATDTVSVTVIVFTPWGYDADGDGVIDKSEVIDAVGDYFDGFITKDQALEVIALYFG